MHSNSFHFSRNKNKDLEKLSQAFFANIEHRHDGEYGSIGTDCKRPFGNSDVEGDTLEIIGADMWGDDGNDECWSRDQRDYATSLYDELPNWMREKYLSDTEIKDRYDWTLRT